MQLSSIKIAVAWVLAVCVAGLAASLSSLSGWTVLAGVVVLPPIVMMWRWNDPPQLVAGSIHEGRR